MLINWICHSKSDSDLLFKANQLKINRSKIFNNVLKNLVSQYSNNGIDMIKVEEELEEIEEKIKNLKIRQTELLTKKISFEEERKKNKDQDLKELLKVGDSIKRSGVMEDF